MPWAKVVAQVPALVPANPRQESGVAVVPLSGPGLALLWVRRYGEKQALYSAYLLRGEFLSLLHGDTPPTHPQFFRG